MNQSIEDASRNSIIEDAKAAGALIEPESVTNPDVVFSYKELEEFTRLILARQSSQSEPVALPPIERDEEMDRTYIPLPGGWEVQTKGKGSSFRLVDTKGDCPRHLVTDEYLQEALEQMARDIHAAAPQQAIPSGWKFTDAEVLEWNKRNDDKFQGKVHEARKAIEDARSMHLLSASPTASIERDK